VAIRSRAAPAQRVATRPLPPTVTLGGMREATLQAWVIGAVHIHLHFHARGPQLDYVGVLVAAALSWVGLPGPGEAALIAAAILAANHHLDLPSLIAVAWLGATAGGLVGWLVGLKAGRGIVTAAGPLRHHRLAVVARGDRFFARFGVVAVLFTPSWIAGIHAMPWTRYVPINAVSALVWAVGVGLGAYVIGPPIADIVGDIGAGAWLVIGALVLGATIILLLRKHRARNDR
jgi:membrane protein DedA with SNARE-associated domain